MRKSLLHALITASMALLVFGCSDQQESVAIEEAGNAMEVESSDVVTDRTPPNILLITVDDLGFSDLAPFGGEISTPHLAELAQQGAMYTNFHTAVKCNPTRAMLNTGIDNNLAATGPRTDYQLSQDALTSAEMLREEGYHTYIAGKWDNGSDPGEEPFHRGFDRTYVMLPGAGPHYKSPMEDNTGNTSWRADGEPVYIDEDFYSSITYTDKMIEFIDSNLGDGKPFFAFASYTAPHYPMQAPQEAIDKYLGNYDVGYQVIREQRFNRLIELGLFPEDLVMHPLPTLPEWNALSEEDRVYESKRMAIYAAMIDLLDAEIGRLLDYLDEQGLADNTLVFFMSDNGADGTQNGAGFQDWHDNSLENLGTASSYKTLGPAWAHVASTPLNWYKTFTTEGGVRTPAIARMPDLIEAGQVSNQWFQVMDLTPTFLELAGVEHPGSEYQGRSIIPIQGRSLMGLFDREEAVYSNEDYRFHTYVEPRLGGSYVQKGDWKLAWWKENRIYIEPRLFNVATDPAEVVDVAAEHSELVEELFAAYLDYAEANGIVLEDSIPESRLVALSE